jgi:hypothetical protein
MKLPIKKGIIHEYNVIKTTSIPENSQKPHVLHNNIYKESTDHPSMSLACGTNA